MSDPARAGRRATFWSRVRIAGVLLLVGAAAGVELEYAVVDRLFHTCPPVLPRPVGRFDWTGKTPPHVVDHPMDYPWAGLFADLQSTVQLAVRVEPDGHVSQVRLMRSSGFCPLDAAALDGVWSWHYQPATRDGVPFATWWFTSVMFRLKGDSPPPEMVAQPRGSPVPPADIQSMDSGRSGH
ncbi:MAG TPA: energy transducer TonB [Rhizomicrobium sp.]|jgi:TonB family protein|nr:energy transducer TonB [Rhizomicrobium sp.]